VRGINRVVYDVTLKPPVSGSEGRQLRTVLSPITECLLNTSAIVFAFDAVAEGVSSWYGCDFDSAFLSALSAIDPEGKTRSSVLRGDAIVAELAAKITAVSGKDRTSGYTQSYDMEVYRTVIWDLTDALSDQWHTVSLETFPAIIGQRRLYCISMPTFLTELRDQMDNLLRTNSGYVGAFEVDLGNQIQRRIFIDGLIADAVIVEGQVIMELTWDGHQETLFEDAAMFRPKGRRDVHYGTLNDLQPVISLPAEPSARGLISLQRYSGKRTFSLQERVTSAFVYRKHSGKVQTPYEFSVADNPSNPLEAELPEAKFVNYLLDDTHPKGGSKAKFFADALGIERKDWRYLAAQLHDGLARAELVEVGVKGWQEGFGLNFNAIIPVKGLNGRTIDILTNWIMEPGRQPRLSTAIPANGRHATELNNAKPSIVSGQPPVVSVDLQGNQRWEAIFQLASDAGCAAAVAAVPTPMRVHGFGIEMEGLCGLAWVRVKDARRGFAKWAIANKHAYHHHQSGAEIFAQVASQSVDRAKAYATAFATVLRHNGIECEVGSRLD
jgi:Domain of unknown function (DUF6883)